MLGSVVVAVSFDRDVSGSLVTSYRRNHVSQLLVLATSDLKRDGVVSSARDYR